MTLSQLDALRGTAEVDRSQLVDISTIKTDKNLPAAQRMEQYLAQVKNPYCFLCGDSVVRLRFNDDGNDLKSSLKNYFISCKKA